MAYPRKEMEAWTDGRQERIVNTDDFLTIAENESKMKLDWFFELYLRQPKLPRLVTQNQEHEILLKWETPNNMPFPMPVEVEVDGKIQRVKMENGSGRVTFQNKATVDPNGWVLKEMTYTPPAGQ
jgi:aminopeptidase N